jgi:hypothetical protein
VEACEHRETPPWAAKEALRDIRVGWETETPPAVTLVAAKANDNYRREAASRVPQQYPDRDPDMKGEDFASLIDWWRPRLNHPDHKKRSIYQKAWKVVSAGGIPTPREPGED